DEEVMKKIEVAHRAGKPVDGHAPGLRGEQARLYIEAGISTDHECFTREEALEKLSYGMKILIREGSAARNFEALADLLDDHADRMMFCSDDKHPDSLEEGHINLLCARAVARGIDIFKVLAAACVNPVLHYKLDIGLLRKGDPADFIVVQDLTSFKVLKTFVDGNLVAENGQSKIEFSADEHNTGAKVINNFHCRKQLPDDFIVPFTAKDEAGMLADVHGRGQFFIPVIEALEGQLITNRLNLPATVAAGTIVSNPEQDILKLAVINRYAESPIAISFIRNFGLKSGALASSVAHDSHNIIAVGVDDESMCRAVNLVIREKGGISCVDGSKYPANFPELVLPLPVAGLMSAADAYDTAKQYTAIDAMAKSLGSTLAAPFMTLSFMALLVIPHLKLSDRGLFDGDEFRLLR
ncbi:MAG TPA: adenine deaminase C-terminal domain-containing protein, partial [Chitinophagaceae bacterium]|nr:adenine deaminase C-terminal domain-containing protein [Chitinophagaceae bacterium]